MDSLCFDDNKEDNVVKSDLSSVYDEVGDQEAHPRVGDQYQAELPSLIEGPHHLSDSEIAVYTPEPFALGLTIPLMWTHCRFEKSRGTSESVTSEDGRVICESGCPKVKVVHQSTLLGEGENMGGSKFQSSSKCDETDINSYTELKTGLDQSRGKYLLPGLLVDQAWTDIEYNSFLLGLYVFGKNLNLLKRFVGSKNMGDILYFYYGKFYKSKGYCRWSRLRKMKTRRGICGQKIFAGWRQQELMSRIFPRISGECQTMLVEISRNFVEGKMPFENYVFALKDAVGIDMLIDAVGIGKGKQDLTGTAVEPTKTNHISVRPEIPVGKACSSLASAEIIKFLTGNFRLSKARSNDIFWEAVWPRLLAKGWHSEEPKDHVGFGSKQSLVFLVPGVKKFSRRKLVKGNHYFDSVSDVLNKVASDPGLLENEIQATEGNADRENGHDNRDSDGLSNRRNINYLQPLGSKCKQDVMKFTIVDTSMVSDSDQRKVRQLRSLPVQPMCIFTVSSCSSESKQDTSEDLEDQVVELVCSSNPIIEDHVDQANSSNLAEDYQVEQTNFSNPEFSDKGVSISSSDCAHIPEALNTTMVEVENHEHHPDLHNNDHSRKINEHQFIQNVTSDCSKSFPYFMDVQRLKACSHGEVSHSTETTCVNRKFDLNEPVSPPSYPDEAYEGVVLSAGLENLSLPSNLAKDSPNMSNEGCATENHLVGGEVSAEHPETRMLIDLNFPQVSPDLGIDMEIPSSMDILQNDNQFANSSSSPSERNQFNAIQEFPPDDHKEQESIIVNRRQSTRNRPLTTKALEALEYRFLNSKRKRKNSESSDNNSKSQCLNLSSRAIVGASCDNGIGNSVAEARAEEENVIRQDVIRRAYCHSIDLNEVQYDL